MNTDKRHIRFSSFPKWLLIPSSVVLFYLLLEIITYILICSSVLRPDFMSIYSEYFGASDKPYARFDSISGYKYMGSTPHLTSIKDDSIMYDHIMHVNNRGYSSIYDYTYLKKKGRTRWMVLGDSYTAGEITDTTWVDLVQKRLGRDSVELYNFALEAAGICNWHSIFFKEIVPNYEFDGLIIAAFGDLKSTSYDFARPWAVKHSLSDHTGLNFFPVIPSNTEDFKKEYEAKLFYDSSIYDSSDISFYKSKLLFPKQRHYRFELMPPRTYLLNYLVDAVNYIREFKAFQEHYTQKDIDPKILSGAYKGSVNYNDLFGTEKLKRVSDILNYCKEHDKKIYLVSIPSFKIVEQDSLFYHNNIYNRHLEGLAKQYSGDYFDGYRIFDSIPRSDRNRFELYGDAHWNRTGIDVFVKIFTLKN